MVEVCDPEGAGVVGDNVCTSCAWVAAAGLVQSSLVSHGRWYWRHGSL